MHNHPPGRAATLRTLGLQDRDLASISAGEIPAPELFVGDFVRAAATQSSVAELHWDDVNATWNYRLADAPHRSPTSELQVDWPRYPGPPDYHPDDVEPSLAALLEVSDEASMWAAYNSVLYAIGNNHAGTLFPASIPALSRVATCLRSPNRWVCTAAGEILTELLAFEFNPSYSPIPACDSGFATRIRMWPFRSDIVDAMGRVQDRNLLAALLVELDDAWG